MDTIALQLAILDLRYIASTGLPFLPHTYVQLVYDHGGKASDVSQVLVAARTDRERALQVERLGKHTAAEYLMCVYTLRKMIIENPQVSLRLSSFVPRAAA